VPRPILVRGATSSAQSSLKASTEGGGKLSGVLEWGEAIGRGKETEGEEGGLVASQATGGGRLGHVEKGNLGAWAAARGVRGAPTRPGASGRGLWSVSDATHVGVLGDEGEREGGREEAGRWAGPWDRPHPSAKQGEREREWQVGPAVI
jgi:hypothetical protein